MPTVRGAEEEIAGRDEFADLEGTLVALLERTGSRHLVVRPDRYVHAETARPRSSRRGGEPAAGSGVERTIPTLEEAP
ncbi:MAG: hypothetical protein U0R24_10100 [Solirubrobacterales bacterium]